MKKFTLFLSAMLISLMSFAQTVPTQEELWASFQTAAGLNLGTLDNLTAPALNTISGNLNADNLNKVFAEQEWQWLKTYVKTTQDAQVGGSFVDGNGTTRTVPALVDEITDGTNVINWRYAVAAFFVQSQYVGFPAASADFTEAGKPEAWGPAYLAAPELPTYDVTVADATVTTGQWSIDLAGTWEERTVTIKLWQDNVQGFGEYAANAETGYTCQLGNPYAELIPTTAGLYADNGDGTFTFTATMTDAEGGIYNISVTGAIPADEPEIDWIPMELEISNLTTMEMPVEGVTYLQLTGRDDKEDADVMLFLNNYTGENKAYEVNVESSYMTFGGSELTVIDGSITQSVDPELGDTVYAGIVHASVGEEGETMYVEFTLKMYALEPIEIELEDVEIVVNEESAIAFFRATWEGSPLQVEVSGFKR